MKTLIAGAHALGPDGKAEPLDILIEDGLIASVEAGISRSLHSGPGVAVIRADGLFALPGLVDAHCHLREPGFEYKEDIASGTASAARGGFTSVACMPNTDPAIDGAQVVEFVLDRAAKAGMSRVLPIGAITKGLLGAELSQMGELAEAGAVAVSDDGKPVSDGALMRKAMLYSKLFKLPVISHCEALDISEGGDMNEGKVSFELGLRGVPSVAESAAVARDLLLAEHTGARVHIAHVSTAASVELVRMAKRRGADVTCETCPHYFTLTDEACRGYDAYAKVNPPLATDRDVEAVIEGLCDGTIDIIATDHAPHSADEKNAEFSLAPSGIAGFETAFGLAYTKLVLSGYMTLAQLADKMSRNPAALFGLEKRRGAIAAGFDADITLVDLSKPRVVDSSRFLSKARGSPFDGMELRGWPQMVIIGGKTVCDETEYGNATHALP